MLTDNASDTVRGIMFAVLAYMIWTLGDATAKLVLPEVGIAAAMLWRGVFGAIMVLGMTMGWGGSGWRRLMPRRWRLVLVRSVLSSFVSVTWYVSWLSMSLADTYAIGFIAPLLMTVLAVPMLGERIRWRRALSTLVGFGGVLIMLRPGGDLWTPVVLLLLVGTLVMALTRIMTRQLTTTEIAGMPGVLAVDRPHGDRACAVAELPGIGPRDRGAWLVGAGVPGCLERAGALRVRARLRAGAGVGAGALRILDDAVRHRVRLRAVQRRAVMADAGRRRGGGGVGQLQCVSRTGAAEW